MVGHGELSDIESPLFPPEVKCFDLNPRDGCFGPEVGFARHFLDVVPGDELWLVKYAVGGSSLLAWKPEWSAERAAITGDEDKGALYPRLNQSFQASDRGTRCQSPRLSLEAGRERQQIRRRRQREYHDKLEPPHSRECARDLDQPEMQFVSLACPTQLQPVSPTCRLCDRRRNKSLKTCRMFRWSIPMA